MSKKKKESIQTTEKKTRRMIEKIDLFFFLYLCPFFFESIIRKNYRRTKYIKQMNVIICH
jgi:hypothetical protein